MDCCEHTEPAREHTAHAHHGDHAHMGHGGGMTSHGSASDFLRRFWIVTALLVPLALTNASVAGLLHVPTFAGERWVAFALATAIFGFALVFFQHAWHEIKMRAYGMMTLVSLAVGAGYAFSVVSTFIPSLRVEFYLEIGTLVWVLLFGHYLEARSGAAAGDALAEVAKLLPKKAHRIEEGKETEVAIEELKEGDLVLVKPGEKTPADGTVVEGSSGVNESLVSGESVPVTKQKDATVLAGSIVEEGALTVRLTRVGEQSTVGQIRTLVASAKRTKPRSQRLADKASRVLTFVSLAVAIATVLVWVLIVGKPLVFAFTLAITVLVITCPHALGLAIPAVTSIATSLAVKNGVFIKNLGKIEVLRNVRYVMFDKTGTLTEGRPEVNEVRIDKRYHTIVQSLEARSAHPLAEAILRKMESEGNAPAEVQDFKSATGRGVAGTVEGKRYFLGNYAFLKEQGIMLTTEEKEGIKGEESQARTAVLFSDEERYLGFISLSDKIKESARRAIADLKKIGVGVVMLSGDNTLTAQIVAERLEIEEHYGRLSPEEKLQAIREHQKDGGTVAFVGDGVNDAPALAQADVGVAIGAGTDVAVESGDVVLTRSNPEDVVRLIVLAKKVYAKMVQNLVWALGYNVIAIPAAAGVFAAWGFFLRPEVGALVMSLSTVIVVINALTLRRTDLTA